MSDLIKEILILVFFTGTGGFSGQPNSLSLLVGLVLLEILEKLVRTTKYTHDTLYYSVPFTVLYINTSLNFKNY